MTEHKPADTPRSLDTAGRKLWREAAKVHALRQDELEALKAACAEADLIEKMEAELKGQPLTVTGSQGQIMAHPLVQELRQHRSTMVSLLRGLKLPDDEAGAAKASAQRAGGSARWELLHGKSS